MTKVASYLMNPTEDTVLFGDELCDGMWVLLDNESLRTGSDEPEEVQLRAQRFCRVTRLRFHGGNLTFVGEWVDGYQKAWESVHAGYAWIVKKASIPGTGSSEEG